MRSMERGDGKQFHLASRVSQIIPCAGTLWQCIADPFSPQFLQIESIICTVGPSGAPGLEPKTRWSRVRDLNHMVPWPLKSTQTKQPHEKAKN
ncbi:hypothetical protein TNCV_526001 [Trichonephila clavipes]|nr:hypothetical protein TNCV_526001 [Trichonephila clavipes]